MAPIKTFGLSTLTAVAEPDRGRWRRDGDRQHGGDRARHLRATAAMSSIAVTLNASMPRLTKWTHRCWKMHWAR